MRVFVCQIGARRHYAVPVALHRAGMLEAVATDWCANRGLAGWATRHLPSVLKPGSLKRMSDRLIPEIPARSIWELPGHQALGKWYRWRRTPTFDNYSRWVHVNKEFGEQVASKGFGQASAVYAFNAAALEVFEAAKTSGLVRILDQTMAPWEYVEPLLEEERLRWPGWEPAPPADAWREMAQRERREWDLADVILCGSSFVVDAVAEVGGPAHKCRVVPYGFHRTQESQPVRRQPAKCLKVLCVGTVDLRKGIPYLLQAAELLRTRAIEFRIVGPIGIRESAVDVLRRCMQVVGPVPRSVVPEHYCWADLFVLPTLAEGSANVCYEAMAHGLPLVTTPNAGSVVRDGQDGWIVPVRSAEAIATRLDELAAAPELTRDLGRSALKRVEGFTWKRYQAELAKTVRNTMVVRPGQQPVSVS